MKWRKNEGDKKGIEIKAWTYDYCFCHIYKEKNGKWKKLLKKNYE